MPLLVVLNGPTAAETVTGSGTGFFVNRDGWVVTNAHVVEGCASVSVPGLGDASALQRDGDNDLAAFRVRSFSATPPLPWRETLPRLGEEIVAFGFPLAGLLSDSVKVTTGNVNSLVGIGNDPRHVQISAPVQPGNSGGPVVDMAGAVLGMAVGQLGSEFNARTNILPQNVNFAIRSGVVRYFLQSRGIDIELADPAGPRLATADLAERVAQSVVQVLCHGSDPDAPPPPPAAPAASDRDRDELSVVDGADTVGFDYAALRDSTASQCIEACAADPRCLALTYNRPARFCFLKDGAALMVRNGDAFTAVRQSLLGRVAMTGFTVRSGHDMRGGDYRLLKGSNFVACFAACARDDVCRAFAFVRRNGSCWLKNVRGRVTAQPGVELGMR